MTALELKQPGIIFRGLVLMMQGEYQSWIRDNPSLKFNPLF
jgi:hypothetical protein